MTGALTRTPPWPGLLEDEHSFAQAVDLHSPALLDVACCVATGPAVHVMVETAWAASWRSDLPAGPSLPVALVRQLARELPGEPLLVRASRRRLRTAIAGCAALAHPEQRFPLQAGSGRSRTVAERMVALPAPLRLVLVLSDVHRWPPADVHELLQLDAAQHRRLLGRARHQLTAGPADPR